MLVSAQLIAQGFTGGVIRGSAACCGLVGIKPSRCGVSQAHTGDNINGLAININSPLARNLPGAAALFICDLQLY